MERITGNQVQSIMEALNQVYVQPEVEQLDESRQDMSRARARQRQAQERARVEADRRVQAAGGGAAAEKAELERLRKANVRPQGTGQQRWRPQSDEALTRQARYNVRQRGQEALKNNPDFKAPEKATASTPSKPKPGENLPPSRPAPAAQTVTAKNASGQQQQVTVGRKYDATLGGQKGTVTYDAAGKRTFTANKPVAGDTAPATPTGNTAADKTPAPAARPVPTGTTASGQKFERRLPTMAELRAAQAARAAAKAAGTDRKGQEAAAVKAGVTQAQRQASVNSAMKAANRPEVLNRPAPAGSALARQQQAQGRTVSGSGAMGSAANPQVRSQLGLRPINPQPAAARPAATPAARPAATPAARPAATPAARPAATPAARPAATPAARPEPLFGPGSPGYGAGRPKPKPAAKRDAPLW